MNVWNGIGSYPQGRGPVVASIGNYDGVHLGHQSILRNVVGEARRTGKHSLLISFEPHPMTVVAPERRPQLLQNRGQKLESLEATGLDAVLLLDFTPAVAALSGEAFFAELLADRVEFASIHVGWNFRFGHQRSGDHELLGRIGDERGFGVTAVAPIAIDGRTVSSSAIREAVATGDVACARRMLGRPFTLQGEIIRGRGVGAELDFPTANLSVNNELLPSNGVYITETLVQASRFPSVTNVGVRPTFGGKTVSVEAHLLEFDGDLYNERVELRFLDRIRDEISFDGPIELADQIARDRAAAESFFRNLQIRPDSAP
jgi:riboflavin kinase/FMN adenylyltransferase